MIERGLELLAHTLVQIAKNPSLSTERAELRTALVIEQYFRLTQPEHERAGSISGTPQAPGVGVGH